MEVELRSKIMVVAPSLNVGGIGRHLSVFAECFAKKGYNVLFISCINEKQFYSLNEQIKVIKPNFNRGQNPIMKLVFYPKLIIFLRREMLSFCPDFILVFGDIINPLVLLAAKGTGLPVFIGDMTSPDYNHGVVVNILKKWLYPSSKGVVSQTRYANRFKQKQFGDNINTIVLDNPIRKIEKYEVARQRFLLYVGRFTWEKAPDRLLKAFSKLKKRGEWRLKFAGSGPLLKEVKKQARELEVIDNIEFLGKVKDVDRLYETAGIYILPSVVEGFPNALCEAMIAGCPVICFDDWPSHEIVENGKNGFIVTDVEELTEKLDQLINDSNLRQKIGKEASRLSLRLDKELITEKLLKFMYAATESENKNQEC